MDTSDKIKVVSLDFMGVLTDGERACAYEQILYEHLQKFHKDFFSPKEIDEFWKRFVAYNVTRRENHASPQFIPYFTEYLAEKGISSTQASTIALAMLLDQRGWYRIKAGVADIIRLLAESGIKLVLTTDSMLPSLQRRIILQHWGILQYFDMIHTSQEWGRKTGLTIFRNIPAAFKVTPIEVLHIGDSMDNDIIPAKKVGFSTCLFAGKDLQYDARTQEKPDYIVIDFLEIGALIRRINK